MFRRWANITSMADAERRLANAGPNLLVMLPSTGACIRLVERHATRHACVVTSGPVMAPWFSKAGLAEKLGRPSEIVRMFSRDARLPVPVFSFPDQLVGDGRSFELLDHGGKQRRWSSMEALLVLRHAPDVLYVSSSKGWRGFELTPISYRHVTAGFEEDDLPALMHLLLSPLALDLERPPDDWLARDCFSLKEPAVFERRIRHELCDIEALLRIGLGEPGPEQAMIGRMLADVLRLRKESLASRGEWQ